MVTNFLSRQCFHFVTDIKSQIMNCSNLHIVGKNNYVRDVNQQVRDEFASCFLAVVPSELAAAGGYTECVFKLKWCCCFFLLLGLTLRTTPAAPAVLH